MTNYPSRVTPRRRRRHDGRPQQLMTLLPASSRLTWTATVHGCSWDRCFHGCRVTANSDKCRQHRGRSSCLGLNHRNFHRCDRTFNTAMLRTNYVTSHSMVSSGNIWNIISSRQFSFTTNLRTDLTFLVQVVKMHHSHKMAALLKCNIVQLWNLSPAQ